LFPLAPKTYLAILGKNTEKLRERLGEESTVYQEYSGIVAAFAGLRSPATVTRGGRGKAFRFEARERLRQLVSSSAEVESLLERQVARADGPTR